ncbi:2-oxoglutarate-Fe(II)-dependent dioxygenase family protein [Aquimarina sp. MAR_2010_214]|uniref:2OG-Fe dioxygenase family protein n=1 Tax=Aquimarina sp. MAR_2010_214 TaxID=1250026 RepID=UPI000C710690|nr:2OG-Fe dioxygenase family protein [Aquimarina sp. MAR_2010_214]PKV53093.1 2-oxoglutarate-Fe(II)-dependent dioxygenase family protein [Aquimarina sp. MAR_2010_214]
MITEKDISKRLGRTIKSPIRIGDVTDLGIDITTFLNFFKPFFEELQDDKYLVKGKQITFLKQSFPEESETIERIHQSYFEGHVTGEVLDPWIQRLDASQKQQFEYLSTITRQRNIASFQIEIWDDTIFAERIVQQSFEQDVDDFRVWKRVFTQATKEAVENELFFELLKKITGLVKKIHPEIRKLQITSHFMRTISQGKIKGENAPEGVHEDGAQYIMSALVINRQNIIGAESQIYEKSSSEHNELIYSKVLDPGEFIFQADTGEEFTFGNDLWHYVTPIEPDDSLKLGIRDIIGFDIDIL